MLFHKDKSGKQARQRDIWLFHHPGYLIAFMVLITMLLWFVAIMIASLIGNGLHNTIAALGQMLTGNFESGFGDRPLFYGSMFFDHSVQADYGFLFDLILLLLIGLEVWSSVWIYRRYKMVNYNEYGSDGLAPMASIKKQYLNVPDRDVPFKGMAGVPVSHYYNLRGSLNQFRWSHKKLSWLFVKLGKFTGIHPLLSGTTGKTLIDQTTVSNLIVGMTRSGKGETWVNQAIDTLSRASEASSLIINDPKGELYRMSYKSLRERNYDVYALNMKDISRSMSYNPLELIKEYAEVGNYNLMQQEVTNFSTSIYVKKGSSGGDNEYWIKSSVALLSALILETIDQALENDEPEKITMWNVVRLMSELGGQSVNVDTAGNVTMDVRKAVRTDIPKLVVYFEKLRKAEPNKVREMAISKFAQSKMAGENTQGTTYSSALSELTLYQQSDVGQLTARNSVEFEKLGFPRKLEIRFNDNYRYQTVSVKFVSSDGEVLDKRDIFIDEIGYMTYLLKPTLPEHFQVDLSFNHRFNKREVQDDHFEFNGTLNYEMVKAGVRKSDEFTGRDIVSGVKMRLKRKETTFTNVFGMKPFEDRDVNFEYSEKPVAIFLITPPNNQAYNGLVSFFIDQAFNRLSLLAGKVPGGALFTRVHFLIDEFAQLPPISYMATKVSLGLGMGLLFSIIIQSLDQMEINYTKEEAGTIRDNCGNQIYIRSNGKSTVEYFSFAVGNRTVNVSTDREMKQYNRTKQEVLTPQDLMKFGDGEMLIVRSGVHRDKNGKLLKDNEMSPIYNKNMPYRYQYLDRSFTAGANDTDINVEVLHRDLDLDEVGFNYDQMFSDLDESVMEYEQKTQSEAEEDWQPPVPDYGDDSGAESGIGTESVDNYQLLPDRILNNSNLLTIVHEQIMNFLVRQGNIGAKNIFFQTVQKMGYKPGSTDGLIEFWKHHNSVDSIKKLPANEDLDLSGLHELIEEVAVI